MDFNYQIHENLNMVTNEEVLAFTGHMNPKIMSIHDDVGGLYLNMIIKTVTRNLSIYSPNSFALYLSNN